MKTAVALRHLTFEDLGLIEPWLKRRGWGIHYYDIGVDDIGKIDLNRVDLLIVLGGPIGVEDDRLYPYLRDEIKLIRDRINSTRPILGICLGAQLMATSLGAPVRSMGVKEIGFGPLLFTREGTASPLGRIGSQSVLHWHGDQFELPEGVANLASTAKCPHQAFMVGDYAMGWQFHLEVDAARIEQWLIGHSVELTQSNIDIEALRKDAYLHRQGLSSALDSVMSDWFERLGLTT